MLQLLPQGREHFLEGEAKLCPGQEENRTAWSPWLPLPSSLPFLFLPASSPLSPSSSLLILSFSFLYSLPLSFPSSFLSLLLSLSPFSIPLSSLLPSFSFLSPSPLRPCFSSILSYLSLLTSSLLSPPLPSPFLLSCRQRLLFVPSHPDLK